MYLHLSSFYLLSLTLPTQPPHLSCSSSPNFPCLYVYLSSLFRLQTIFSSYWYQLFLYDTNPLPVGFTVLNWWCVIHVHCFIVHGVCKHGYLFSILFLLRSFTITSFIWNRGFRYCVLHTKEGVVLWTNIFNWKYLNCICRRWQKKELILWRNIGFR